MKKICLVVVGLYVGLLSAFAQTVASADSTHYKSRKLKIDEVNFVSSYYHQDGDHSAVTGGIGTEKLTDLSNYIDVKLLTTDKRDRKHSFTLGAGIDHYTSASSDKIDPKTISSASSADTRFYPSLGWEVANEKKGTTYGLNTSYSTEYDYQSFGFGAGFSKKSTDGNREFGVKAQVYLDEVSIILPVELRVNANTGGRERNNYPLSSRNSYSGSFAFSQVINERLQVSLLADLVYQKGFLSLPFHRVYFNDNTEATETLPGSRFKLPLGVRMNYFLGDKIIIRAYYRYYQDDWGLKSNTVNLETPIKITPFFSVSPFYRFYTQSAVSYFAPYLTHAPQEQFYSSNYDLSKFNSQFFGAGFRVAPPAGVLGINHFTMFELRYGHYAKNNGMNSDIVSMNLKFR